MQNISAIKSHNRYTYVCRKLPEAGIRTLWELLQYYPRDYQNFEAGAWRDEAHVMAAGHVDARQVSVARGMLSCRAALRSKHAFWLPPLSCRCVGRSCCKCMVSITTQVVWWVAK